MATIEKTEFQDAQGNISYFRTSADMVVMPDGRTLADIFDAMLTNDIIKENTVTSSANTPLIVDESIFIDDTENYRYSLELLSAISGSEKNFPVTPVLHVDEKTIVIARTGITAGKALEITYRLIKHKIRK